MTNIIVPVYDFENDGETFPETVLPITGNFHCSFCVKKFTTNNNLVVHEIFKHHILPYKCPKKKCNKTFAKEEFLKEHIEFFHKKKGVEKSWKCTKTEKCIKRGTAFETETKLKHHIATRHGKKKFQCDKCEKNFTTKYELEVHSKKHTQEKPFSCEKCGTKFASIQSKKYHDTHNVCS